MLHFEEKETVKAMPKGDYISWLLRGDGPFFGKWWVVVDIFWLVLGGGGYILKGDGW